MKYERPDERARELTEALRVLEEERLTLAAERLEVVRDMRELEYSCARIARALGVSRTQAQGLVEKAGGLPDAAS